MKKMGHKAPSDIYWTILELKGLLEDEESCVYFERHRTHLGMASCKIRNIDSALREILNSKLNAYDAELDGLLLAYKNPIILTPVAGILNDTSYIHIDVEADFYIFRPKVDAKLKGFVNKVGFNHIAVLVHRVFIASIPQPENEEDWPGNNVKMRQEIKFTVNQVDFSSKLPYIRGVLYEDEYLEGCKLFNEDLTENYERIEMTETSKNISFQEDFVDDSSGISARKRKRITFESDSEDEEVTKVKKIKLKSEKNKNSSSNGNSQDIENDNELEDRKPKIKKRKKIVTDVGKEENENPVNNSSIDENTQDTENDNELEDRKPKIKKHRQKIEKEENVKQVNSSIDENAQDTENHNELEDRKPKIKKHRQKIKKEENVKQVKNSSIDENAQDTENHNELEDRKPKIKKHRKKIDTDVEKEENVKSIENSLIDENTQDTENEIIDQKPKIKKHKSSNSEIEKEEKNVKLNKNSQDTENDNEADDQESIINKSPKKMKKLKRKIKIEPDSDEIENVIRKIKTEPCDEIVKVKKEPTKLIKCKIQPPDDSD